MTNPGHPEFEKHRLGKTRYDALTELVRHKRLRLHGRPGVASHYVTPDGRFLAVATVHILTVWLYARYQGTDGDVEATHLGVLACNHEKRRLVNELFATRRAQTQREDAQEAIDARARNKYRPLK